MNCSLGGYQIRPFCLDLFSSGFQDLFVSGKKTQSLKVLLLEPGFTWILIIFLQNDGSDVGSLLCLEAPLSEFNYYISVILKFPKIIWL